MSILSANDNKHYSWHSKLHLLTIPMCSAIIIGYNHVLLAAHCFHNNEYPLKDYEIGVMENNSDGTNAFYYSIIKRVIHPKYIHNYNENLQNYDIAIAVIHNYFKNVIHLSLPYEAQQQQHQEHHQNLKTLINSNGLNQLNAKVIRFFKNPDNINAINVNKNRNIFNHKQITFNGTIMNNEKCKNYFKYFFNLTVTEHMFGISISSKYKDVIPPIKTLGGSPLIINNKLYGIQLISSILNDGNHEIREIYVNIVKFIDWIRREQELATHNNNDNSMYIYNNIFTIINNFYKILENIFY